MISDLTRNSIFPAVARLFALHEVGNELTNFLLGGLLLLLAAAIGFAMRVTGKLAAIDARLSTIVEEHERRLARLEDDG